MYRASADPGPGANADEAVILNHQGNSMKIQTTCRALLAVLTASLLSASLIAPANAGNAVRKGHGVKCYWMLVSSDPATGANVYQYVCGRGA